VYVSNEDYRKDGTAAPEEKAERNRIYREAAQAKLSSGTVHVYILAPDGHCIDSQHVATASKVDQLTEMLERTIARLKTPAGEPIVKPTPQSVPVHAGPDAVVLHLTARNLVRQGDDYVIPKVALGETKAANWGAYPGENWITLEKKEWLKFVPDSAKPGVSWDVDRDVAAKILNYFYPSTENNDIRTNRILEQSLKATVLSVQDSVCRVRLDGRLKMKHPFYHRDDDQVVEATVVGALECETAKPALRSFQLVTDHAIYGRRPFGVAVRNEPAH
jgi:hypothetical protein